MKEKIPNQQATWDNIAKKWKEYREVPSPTVIKFLNTIKKENAEILDLGCGSGRNFVKPGSKKYTIYGLDFSKEMLKHAKASAQKKKINVETKLIEKEKIPFEDNFFDAAICVAVLHCVEPKNQIKLMKELYRVMKPKSKVLISVWGRTSPRLRNKPKECFVPWTIKREEHISKEQRYTYIYDSEDSPNKRNELKEQAESVGFKVLRSWEERNINIIVEK